MLGELGDLHAVEACYHRNCMNLFFANSSMQTKYHDDDGQPSTTDDNALREVTKTIASNKERI